LPNLLQDFQTAEVVEEAALALDLDAPLPYNGAVLRIYAFCPYDEQGPE
jgi:hypothetical protein